MRKKIRKRKWILYLFAVIILISAQFSVYAQTSGESTAQVEFIAGTGPTYPVNPENPGESIETETPVTGSLVLVSVSNFNFGSSLQISGNTAKYNITTFQPNIQVADLRGTRVGWSVTASLSGFTSGSAPTLQGASIHISNVRPNSTVSTEYAPVQTADIELTSDNAAVKVITASEGNGSGHWVMRWYPPADQTNAYIQLEIPGGTATVGTHTASINWTLQDTP